MRSLPPDLQARLAALQHYKIKHSSLEKMDDLLRNAIDEHTSYGILALYGASGIGKSTVMKRVAEHYLAEEPDSSVVPVVVVQASPEDVGSAARLDFYRQVLNQLREHVAVRDRILNLPLARERGKKSTNPAEWLEIRDAVSYALDLLSVKAVCIDEAQRILGKPSVLPNSSLQPPPLTNGSTTLPVPSKSPASSRIERAVHRDPVGELLVQCNEHQMLLSGHH